MPKVLVVDDEIALGQSLEKGLMAQGFDAQLCHDGKSAVWKATAEEFDLVILDMMLPGYSGVEVISRIRGYGIDIPILMLTAVDDDGEVARCLNLGADDYLTKPFNFDVLVARLRALSRRSSPPASHVQMIGTLSVNPDTHEVSRGDTHIELTPREFQLLECLIANQHTTMSKQEILDDVWTDDYFDDLNVVEVYVGYLRKKIDTPFGLNTIKTIRGFGYRLESDV